MTCVDRYILRVFFRTLAICFISIAGVFIVFHAFTNADELNERAMIAGGILPAMLDFYGPMTFMLFETTSMLVSLLALIFTFGFLRRSGELTAMLACGVSHGRIVRPMLVAVFLTLGAAAINREFFLPRFRDQIGLNASSIAGNIDKVDIARDHINGILITGRQLNLQRQQIIGPKISIYASLPDFGDQLDAELATWQPADRNHPSGYLLHDVLMPLKIDSIPSQRIEGSTTILTPHDNDWLPRDSCFVATSLEPDYLRGIEWARMASSAELIRRVSNPAIDCGHDLSVKTHDRWIRPFLDFSLVILSLGIVVGRRERNLFVAAGYATGLVGVYFGTINAFHLMGGNSIVDPVVAAWVPFIIFAPFAYARWQVVRNT